MGDVNCTESQMRSAIQRSLSFHHFPLPMANQVNAPTDVNYVSNYNQ